MVEHNFHSKGTPDFADPMYLDTEGINFMRANGQLIKILREENPEEEILYEIYKTNSTHLKIKLSTSFQKARN